MDILKNSAEASRERERQSAESAYQAGLEEQPDKKGVEFLDIFNPVNVLLVHQERGTVEDPWFAQVIKNKMIRIHGCYGQTTKFDKVFIVGDKAIYDGYNLFYLARIVKITDKTVSFERDNGRIKRLKLYDFINRNLNFTLADAYKHNSQEMNCI